MQKKFNYNKSFVNNKKIIHLLFHGQNENCVKIIIQWLARTSAWQIIQLLKHK